MKIEHNSRLKLYRSPFGAVTTGENVNLSISISEGGLAHLVCLHYKFKDKNYTLNMSYQYQIGDMCLYSARLTVPDSVGLIWYYFEIINEKGHVFYSNNEKSLGGIGKIYDSPPQNAFQITVYDPSYKTPDWFKESVVYQIFPDRFYNGNVDNSFCGDRTDIIKRNWGDTPFYKAEQFGGEYKANDFFGGNIKGITKKLEYLSNLGVDVIYLNPIFKAYSNHKYDTGNYMQIDEGFGTFEDFLELIDKAEKLNIKIILDGVFNHTGSDSIYFNKDGNYDSIGAYQSKESKFYSWYNFNNWPDDYESWWGMKTLPNINESSEEYQDYVIRNEDSVVKYWIKNGISGWRLDVVDELPGFFVKELRKAVKSVNKDAVIIGEVWEDASNKESYGVQREYFLGQELDSVMNYPLRRALIDFAKNNINAEEFDNIIMSIKENYPTPSYYSLLNIISSHDVERIITAVSNAPYTDNKDFMANYHLQDSDYQIAKNRVKQVVAMQMLMPGVPSIYYGDEIGMQGYKDPFCRGCFLWDNTNNDLNEFYKRMIILRKSSIAFTKGDIQTIYKINSGYAFIRIFDNEKYIVCTNFGETPEHFRLDLARFDIHNIENCISQNITENYKSDDGIYYVEMKPSDIKVFKAII